MGKALAVMVGVVIGAAAGVAGGYLAWHHGGGSCTGTERQLAHVLSAEAQGYAVENGRIKLDIGLGGGTKPRQLSASELALVRQCNR